MKEVVARQWITALRSDEYQQCTGQLRDTNGANGYCCLGVLTDLYVKSEGTGDSGEWTEGGTFVYTDDAGYERSEGFSVPNPVMAWAGLRTSDPVTTGNDPYSGECESKYATALNDDELWSFHQIAEWVEDNWETL